MATENLCKTLDEDKLLIIEYISFKIIIVVILPYVLKIPWPSTIFIVPANIFFTSIQISLITL